MAASKKAAPAKKAAPKKTAIAEATGKAMTRWEAKMAELAAKAVETESSVGGGKFINTKGGVLSFDGAEMPDNEMDVIVLDHILENKLYGEDYDADNPASPICFAFGREEGDMAPHKDSAEPQNAACDGCPMNEYGSADRGKGKACKNVRRLAVIPVDGLDDVDNAEIAFLNVPVTSVKGWAGYVRQLATTLNRPPLGVITRVRLERDDKTMFKMKFELVEQVEDADIFEALIRKSELAATEIEQPYQPPSDEPRVPKRGAGRKAGRSVPTQTRSAGRNAAPATKAAPQRGRAAPSASQEAAPPARTGIAPRGKGAAASKVAVSKTAVKKKY